MTGSSTTLIIEMFQAHLEEDIHSLMTCAYLTHLLFELCISVLVIRRRLTINRSDLIISLSDNRDVPGLRLMERRHATLVIGFLLAMVMITASLAFTYLEWFASGEEWSQNLEATPLKAGNARRSAVHGHQATSNITSEAVFSRVTRNIKKRSSICSLRCSRSDVKAAPLLVISFDGFNVEYRRRGIVRSLEQIERCGVSAEYMYASYPSKTFPNHYTIATGLYPEAHGIVDNAVYDSELLPELVDIKRTRHPGYYRGHPIWNVVEENNRLAACIFWPGCGNGRQPTYNLKYNKSMANMERIDKLISWLTLPEPQRPSLLMAYFDQPDSAGHFQTTVDDLISWLTLPEPQRPSLLMAYFDQPDSAGHFQTTVDDVNRQLAEVDSTLVYLFARLRSVNLMDCVNLVVVSDHGMQKLHKRYYLNEQLNTTAYSLPELKRKLKCECKRCDYRLYDWATMPKRYHFAANRRIGDLIVEGRPGTILFSSRNEDSNITADHGYDYLERSMHTIFFAKGPDIAVGVRLRPFQNIELFSLMAKLLMVRAPSNNGTEGALDEVLRDKKRRKTTSPQHLVRCNVERPVPVKRCGYFCEQHILKKVAPVSKCLGSPGSSSLIGGNSHVCSVPLCSAFAVVTKTGSDNSKIIVERLSGIELEIVEVTAKQSIDSCVFTVRQECPSMNANDTDLVKQQIIASDPRKGYAYFDLFRVPLLDSFYNGAFKSLQNITSMYARKYGKLIVITGTIYDHNNDGIADKAPYHKMVGEKAVPSHIFRIVMRCDDSVWSQNEETCETPHATRVIAFIIPHVGDDLNCLEPFDYLASHLARVRDIELLTNIEFFIDRSKFDSLLAVHLRTSIANELWNS
ncbi:Ectonucleotide pyrophosphatase/phosphodiesterase C27A7.1 [Toxocara canis]|uniref:Ectonucleotide pyrophosphatase/phosphodiesterase C27A7.1 n=1 Tax=Toxocara canis TaxID=6265 RepID=A0A0B2UXK0_TOXCA|nr:Ectonucleotide pyrophosphatase/phosphodiesterase C27A7.1 [Toxocara canis]